MLFNFTSASSRCFLCSGILGHSACSCYSCWFLESRSLCQLICYLEIEQYSGLLFIILSEVSIVLVILDEVEKSNPYLLRLILLKSFEHLSSERDAS